MSATCPACKAICGSYQNLIAHIKGEAQGGGALAYKHATINLETLK